MLYVLLTVIVLVAMSVLYTAPQAWREQSVSWKAAAIPAIMDVTETETTEGVTNHRTDNATTMQATFVDGIGAEVKVTTTNIKLRGTTGYTIGANGVLVVVGEQRAEGVGAVSASTTTRTYGDATLIAIENGLPIAGKATLVLTFRCVDPAGVACCVFT